MALMRSKYIAAALLVFSVLCALVLLPFYKNRKFRITVLYASTLSYHNAVYLGFMKALKANDESLFEVRSMSTATVGDMLAVASMCESALEESCDCIVTTGKAISQYLVLSAKKRGCRVPVVCIGANDPVELGIVDSLECSGGNAAVVYAAPVQSALQGHILYALCPTITSVMIPLLTSTDVTGEILRKAKGITDFLREQGWRADVIELDSLTDGLERIAGIIDRYDAIMTLENDTFSHEHITGLGCLVKKTNKILFSGTDGGIAEGALLELSTRPEYAGEAGFKLLKEILCEGKSTTKMAVRTFEKGRCLSISRQIADEKGVFVDVDGFLKKVKFQPQFSSLRGCIKVLGAHANIQSFSAISVMRKAA